MSTFTLSSCCCCINLDVGAKIIGYSSTLIAAMSAVLYAVPALLVRLPPPTMVFYSMAAITSGLQFITGWVMICGLYLKRPILMQPWLLLSWMVGGSLLLLSCAGTVMIYFNGEVNQSYVTSVYSLYAMILLYLAAVVRSRRKELVEEIRNAGTLMTPSAIERNVYV